MLGEKRLAVFAKGLLAVDAANGKVMASVPEDPKHYYVHVEANASCAYVYGPRGLATLAWKDDKFGPPDQLTQYPIDVVAANHDPVLAIGTTPDGNTRGLLAIKGRDLELQKFVLEDDNLPSANDNQMLTSLRLQAGRDLSGKIWEQSQARGDLTPRQQMQWAAQQFTIHLANGEGLVPKLPTTVPAVPLPPTVVSSIEIVLDSFTAADGSVFLGDFHHVFAFDPDAKLCHQTPIGNMEFRIRALAGGSLDQPIVFGTTDSDFL